MTGSLAEELQLRAWTANQALVESGLVSLTWGNVSVADRDAGLVAIKPSGVPYNELQPSEMVVVRIDDGAVAHGTLRPSSDTSTHLALYAAWAHVGAVVHTHSHYATVWAQAEMDVPCLGTTHADCFADIVPCTRPLTSDEILGELSYELCTGLVLVECLATKGLHPTGTPGALVHRHGPFSWGVNAADAVENAIALEEICRLAFHTMQLRADSSPLRSVHHNKHHNRKHGSDAYYGQSSPE